ncbi:MAG TPA: hypothetical protein VN765_09085 [Candidatus Acidoferrum sp.]|nr:hypothetical protein [Candidatus Acidoferrum sp.]
MVVIARLNPRGGRSTASSTAKTAKPTTAQTAASSASSTTLGSARGGGGICLRLRGIDHDRA